MSSRGDATSSAQRQERARSSAFRRRPSLGFVWLLLVAVATLLFFGWGLATPLLDEVWRLDIELSLGERPALSRSELRRLQAALVEHPALERYLAENQHAGLFSHHSAGRVEGDYAYLVRAPGGPGQLVVALAGGEDEVRVTARTTRALYESSAAPSQPFVWDLPSDGPFPQLVEIRLQSDAKRGHAVRVDLQEVR